MQRIIMPLAALSLAVGCSETGGASAAAANDELPGSEIAEHRPYDPPATINAMAEWPRQGGLSRKMIPDDPASPHFISATTGPKYDVFDHDTAVANVIELSEMEVVGPVTLEPLDAWREWDARDMRITFAETRFAGGEGVAFFLVNQVANSDQFEIYVIETTRQTFREWGGAARIMHLRQLIPTMDSVPEEQREAIANAPLAGQTALYEAALNQFYQQGIAQMMAMTQAQTLNQMRELNYDLLFGDDIGSPVIAD